MLLTGLSGSGKTYFVLDRMQAAIRENSVSEAKLSGTKLIVPTISMARHLEHQLVRRGLTLSGNIIETISDFVRRFSPEIREPGPVMESWLLRRAIAAADRAEFQDLAPSAGLRAHLADLIREFASAGFGSADVAPFARDRYQRAFVAVFREYERALRESGFSSAGEELRQAAVEIRRRGLGPLRAVYLDGFLHFSAAERLLISALDEKAETLVVTAPAELENPFPGFPIERLSQIRRPSPKRRMVRASTTEREIEEIARRIAGGQRPFHEYGLILRSPDLYEPIVRLVFARFGIPYRMRFPIPLGRYGAIAYLRALLGCIEKGFPGEDTLELFHRGWSPVGLCPEYDEYDFYLRRQLPGKGLAFMRRHAERFPKIGKFFESLSAVADWERRERPPSEWASAVQGLAASFLRTPGLPAPMDASRVAEIRSLADSLKQFEPCAVEAAELLGTENAQPVPLSEYARALDVVLAETLLAARDERRNVVNVLTVYEARQWELPVVFVCGLVEKQFPRRHSRNLFFSDRERENMARQGIELRTAARKNEEERFLFDIAVSRATAEVFLTYPENDMDGTPLVRSSFLADQREPPLEPPVCHAVEPPPPVQPYRPARLQSKDLLDSVVLCHETFSPSSLECYLQCPFQFFARHTLQLRKMPAPPQYRLDALLMGTIIHQTIRKWSENRDAGIRPVLEDIFDEVCRLHHLKDDFSTALIRNGLLADMERFAAEERTRTHSSPPLEGFETEVAYLLDEDATLPLRLRGRIDRYEVLGERAVIVTDYKYSGEQAMNRLAKGQREGTRIQAQLYLLGLQRLQNVRPAGMRYWGLRGRTTLRGWVVEELLPKGASQKDDQKIDEAGFQAILDRAGNIAVEKVKEIRGGSIAVDPDDRDVCKRSCEFRDVCRIEL